MNLSKKFLSIGESLFDFPNDVTQANQLKKLLSSKLKAGESRGKLFGLFGTDELFDKLFDLEDENKNQDVSKLVKQELAKEVKISKAKKDILDILHTI